ncbi:MAG TPA: amidohydrolase family protein [Bryobacteraceae bacterium]|jgi:predicted TIM-barrel fold metal-dependent hydrolase|nr:amidohydrolase family protein [Bryobacteraceae bacterium]
MNRREFATAVFAGAMDSPPIPIIDTHIHLFDTRRPQGVPWPPKDNPILYKPALPDRYRRIAQPLGVVGAIEVEASPWLEDNQWVLDLAAHDHILVGTIGDLEPGQREFPSQLERFHKNPLFRGIRYGNLWGRDLSARISDPVFLAHLKLLARAGLVLDTANPDTRLVAAVVRLSDRLPDLRIVLDHLPNLEIPTDPQARRAYEADLDHLRHRKQVFAKISQVLQVKNRREVLDQLWDVFGEDRVLYGSDWPNSDPFGTYAEVLAAVRPYVESKGRAAAEKYFWKNSLTAYRWVKRDAAQPTA